MRELLNSIERGILDALRAAEAFDSSPEKRELQNRLEAAKVSIWYAMESIPEGGAR